jgi:hypothetical protein
MFKIKKKFKKLIGAVALILAAVSLCAVVGNLSDGFQTSPKDWKLREVNEKNLYQEMAFAHEDVYADGADGIYAEMDEDHVLHVSGTAENEDGVLINVGTVTLKSGTSYVFDSSFNDGSKGTAYMVLQVNGVEYASYKGEVVIPGNQITSDTQATLVLKIAKDCKLNVKFKPVICEGTSADDLVSFYK